jgi:hypothetical protein
MEIPCANNVRQVVKLFAKQGPSKHKTILKKIHFENIHLPMKSEKKNCHFSFTDFSLFGHSKVCPNRCGKMKQTK